MWVCVSVLASQSCVPRGRGTAITPLGGKKKGGGVAMVMQGESRGCKREGCAVKEGGEGEWSIADLANNNK